jgi:WD40 repeat protein
MIHNTRSRFFRLLLLTLLAVPIRTAFTFSVPQDPKPQEPTKKDERSLGVRPSAPSGTADPSKSGANKPEIVLQAGITVPQTQIAFSPNGRLLASMGIFGNSIKLWEVSSGRLLRQLESGIPSFGTSSMTRPFRFSADGQTLIGVSEGRLIRWDVETGRELTNTSFASAKDFFAAQLSEDGRIIAALNLDSTAVRLWESAGRELRSIAFEKEERIASQDAIALSPDGKLLAALIETVKVSRKGMESKLQVVLWDIVSGRKTQPLNVQSASSAFGAIRNQIASLGFSSDGAWLAMRGESSMKIWDVSSGSELKSFSSPIVSSDPADASFAMFTSKFRFSNDKRLLLIVDGNKINLIDTASAATLNTLAGHDGTVVGMSFSTDGKLLASAGTDNQVKLWEISTGREVRTLSGAAMPLSDIAFSPDGRSLALAGHQAASVWELTTGGVRQAVTLPDDITQARRTGMLERGSLLSSDGRFLVAGSNKQSLVKIWNVSSSRELPSISLTTGKELANAAFDSTGRLLALIEKDIQMPSSRHSQSPMQPSASGVPQLPDGFVMPDMSKIMEQMRKDPKKAQEQMKKAQEAMSQGDLSAGMALMESMGMMPSTNKANQSANSLRVFDVSAGRQLQALSLPGGFFNDLSSNSMMSSSALSFSPDGRVLASSSGFTAPIVLRDAGTGKELRSLKTLLSMSVNTLAWSPDGKRLASAHWGMKKNFTDPNAAEFSFEDMTFSIKVWDAQMGTELNSLAGHNNFVNRLAFSNDGRLLASGGYDSTIKLWDLTSGRELHTLKGHTGSIAALDFSIDGRFLVSGSDDGSARLWNAQTGELLATLASLNKGADWLVITPDGLFDGSPGGWNQILWRFTPSTFDVSPVEIFFNEFYHPGLLPDILAGKKPSVAVDISQKDRRQPKLSLELADGQNVSTVSSRSLNVKIKVTDAPAGAQDLRLFRNGSLVRVWRGDVLRGQPSATLETALSIIAGPNQLVAYAFNRDNVKSSDATLTVSGADSLRRVGTLHLLIVGVNQYANEAYNLKFAVADARDFAEEVARQQRKLGRYGEVEVTRLLDQEATKANVLYALNRLAGILETQPPPGAPAGIQKIKAAEPEDAVVIYYAGHGTAQQQRFYLIPHDLGYQGSRNELDEVGLKQILSHSISDLELEQAFERVDAGLNLMVIDACNSGQALEAEEKRRGPMNSKGLAQLAYEKGMYILTAAQSYQAALEAEQLGHGFLTYALVEEGLKSAAADDQPKDGQVVLREWLDYATERVPRMQEEKMRTARDLKIAIAFVEGEDKVADIDQRSLQRPRVFYRRELEARPLIVAKP